MIWKGRKGCVWVNGIGVWGESGRYGRGEGVNGKGRIVGDMEGVEGAKGVCG